MATHYDIVSVDSVASTQDEASERLKATGNTTLVVADRQLRGRGRQGRSWNEPTRGLFSSLAFESDWPVDERAVITLCTAIALTSSIEAVGGPSCDIKWPNDLLIEGGKVAGILVESTAETVTVGCGVNLWWPDPPPGAGAVFDVDPGSHTAIDVATLWVERLLEMLDHGHDTWPRTEYAQRSWTVGRKVTWDGGDGLAVGIADSGGLIVETGEGETIITAGEVHTHQER